MPRGRKPKPYLQAVREGNPGHRPLREGVVLPPSELLEPDWSDLLPEGQREHAAALWARLAPTLTRSVGLTGASTELLVDYCITTVRIHAGERAITRDGVIIAAGRSDRGMVRNPWTTVLNQYRAHWRSLAAELGLTPSAATRLARPQTDDEEDPFDS